MRLPRPNSRRRWAGLTLAGLTILCYAPILRAGFVWDDDHFLTRNPLIHAADGLRRFWCTTAATDYWPVTSTSLWLEWRLWGMNAAGYHATNVLLHAAAVLLLWSLLDRLRVPGAYLAALLFAVHPVNVESVAWITQRKNLLAMVFFLGSVAAFLRSDGHGRLGEASLPRSRARKSVAVWYGLSVLAFILGMLSKGSIAPLPLVLLGLVAWRRRIQARDLWRLSPYFLIAAALTAVNVWFQRHGMPEVIRSAAFPERAASAAMVAWFYLGKSVWPARLAFCYPSWRLDPAGVTAWLPLLALAGASAFLLRANGRLRSIRFGFGYFLIMLVPVLGFADVYFMKYSLVADHYQHLALIGIAGLAGAGWDGWRRAEKSPLGASILLAAAALAVGALGVAAWRECGIFRDRTTLFRSAVDRNPGCWMAENNLGLDLINQGRCDEALRHCQAAVRLAPGYAEGRNNLGIALAALGRLPEAVAQLQTAVRLRPNYPEADNNLGNAFRLQGKLPEAVAAYAQALRLRPAYAEARNNLGVTFLDAGQLPEAVAQMREAIRLQPGYVDAYDNLALALRRSGRPAEADRVAREAARLRGAARP